MSDYRCPICHVNVIGDAAAASCLIEGDTYTHFQCYIADLRARLAAAESDLAGGHSRRDYEARIRAHRDALEGVIAERDAAIARAERAERERDEAVESKDVAWKRLDTATKGGIDYWTWRCRHLEADRDRLRAALTEIAGGVQPPEGQDNPSPIDGRSWQALDVAAYRRQRDYWRTRAGEAEAKLDALAHPPTPAGETDREALAKELMAVHDADGGYILDHPNDARRLADAALAAGFVRRRPEGVTDAQVEAAIRGWYGDQTLAVSDFDREDMRRALAAAMGVGR